MTVLSVVNGLAQMTLNPDTRALASKLLGSCRVQSHEVKQFIQNPKRFSDLQAMIEHYATDREDQARFLRYAGGERTYDIKWHFVPNRRLEDEIRNIIKPATAKALLKIVSAVDQAQPNLLHFPAGPFVQHIAPDGTTISTRIKQPFTIADRPVTYGQFLGLAHYIGLPPLPPKQGSIVVQDPILNVSQNGMNEWIRVLGFLSGVTYRLPKDKEWERATSKNLAIVDLQKEARRQNITAEELVRTAWHRRYANAFLPTAPDRLALGAKLINDSNRIVRMLREGIALSAWDFDCYAEGVVKSDDIYEMIFMGDNRPPMMRPTGYRYHKYPEKVRDEMKKEMEKGDPYKSSTNRAFRLAVSKR